MRHAPVEWYNPYTGLPPLVQALLWFLLAVILATFAAISVLMTKAFFELARLDAIVYLLMPALQLLMVWLVLALFFFIVQDTPFYAGWPMRVFRLVLGFFPVSPPWP